MAIKKLICDLGGVWLPIDEKRTLAAFAALTAGGTALDAAGGASADAAAVQRTSHNASALRRPTNARWRDSWAGARRARRKVRGGGLRAKAPLCAPRA